MLEFKLVFCSFCCIWDGLLVGKDFCVKCFWREILDILGDEDFILVLNDMFFVFVFVLLLEL